MAPRYRTTQRGFIAPHVIEAGSIIETDSDPSGAWMEPLNDEAKDRLEEWYNKEYSYVNQQTGQTVTTRPNLNKRPAKMAEVERAKVSLIHNPPADNTPVQGLAEALASRAESDLVPSGDGETSRLRAAPPVTSGSPDEVRSSSDKPAPGAESVDGSTTIIAPAATGATPSPATNLFK